MDTCIDIHVGSITLDMFRDAVETTQGEDYLIEFSDDQLAKASLIKDLHLDFVGITKVRLRLETCYRIKIQEPQMDQRLTVTDFCALPITSQDDYRCWITLSMLRRIIGKQWNIASFADDRLAKADLINDLGFDSLDVMETLISLENTYNIRIDDHGVGTVRTVADLLALKAQFKRE